MLYESNRLTYFQFKYGLLIMSLVFFAFSIYPLFTSEISTLSVSYYVITTLTLIISGLLFYSFYKTRSKWKIVALNRVRIVVGTGKAEKEYTWLKVESINLSRRMGIYTLHMKNGEEILFTAYGLTNIFTGDTSEMGTIIAKMKRDLSL